MPVRFTVKTADLSFCESGDIWRHCDVEVEPGEQCRVDCCTGPVVRDPNRREHQCTRPLVMVPRCSLKSIRLLTFRSSARI
jgi:hypothetical protein